MSFFGRAVAIEDDFAVVGAYGFGKCPVRFLAFLLFIFIF